MAELKKFVKELPRITQTKSSLTAHVNLADHISKVGLEKMSKLGTTSEIKSASATNIYLDFPTQEKNNDTISEVLEAEMSIVSGQDTSSKFQRGGTALQ